MKIFEDRPLSFIITKIIEKNLQIASAWSEVYGYAPDAVAELLSRSRLWRQVSLSRCLRDYKTKFSEAEEEGRVVVGYTILGALVEGNMKTIIALHYEEYKKDPDAIRRKTGELIEPDKLSIEQLRTFIDRRIWRESPEMEDYTKWNKWVLKIQQQRNAIHAFKNCSVGNQDELCNDIRNYFDFLWFASSCFLPAPDEYY